LVRLLSVGGLAEATLENRLLKKSVIGDGEDIA